MKKFFRYSWIPLVAAAYFLMNQETVIDRTEVVRGPAATKVKEAIPATAPILADDIDRARDPHQDQDEFVPVKNLVLKKRRIPSSLAVVPTDSTVYQGLPAGYAIAPGLRVVRERDFSLDMGDLVSELGGNKVFTPAPGREDENWGNVAYDKGSNRYFPVSSILKIRGITAEGRANIEQSGYEEHYYNKPANVLFITSSPSRLLQDYKALESQGYKVYMEVLQSQHRSR